MRQASPSGAATADKDFDDPASGGTAPGQIAADLC
jgi:hypothetical protein